MSAEAGRASVEIRPISALEAYPTRVTVLRNGVPPPVDVWPADIDPLTFHLGAHFGRELVGVASYIALDLEGHAAELGRQLALPSGVTYKLRGMAVLPEHQRHGIGAALLDVGLRRLAERGASLLWCHARTTAQGFYERQGFAVHGEVFDRRRQPHVVMWRWVESPPGL